MKAIAVIPARLEASRFPEKLLQDLHGKPVIQHTYEAVVQSGLFERVILATDHHKIEKVAAGFAAEVFVSQKDHQCGTDRVAEVAQHFDADIVVNIQGDTPMIEAAMLRMIMQEFDADQDKEIDLISLKFEIKETKEALDPNAVKVVTDKFGFALYFSRALIPYPRLQGMTPYYQHVGVYAFRRTALMDFYSHPLTPLETAEQIEGIRYLEIGKKIKMLEIPEPLVDINTPEDLVRARRIMRPS